MNANHTHRSILSFTHLTLMLSLLIIALTVAPPGAVRAGTPGEFVDSGQALGSLDSLDVALGDVDGDGDLDAFVIPDSDPVWINQGGAQNGTPGVYAASGQVSSDSAIRGIGLDDLDGDGDLDAFMANYDANEVWVNQGGDQGGMPGQFQNSGQVLGSANSLNVALGDLDGDGDVDAFVANRDANHVWVNQGGAQNGVEGQFQESGQALGNSISWGLALGDVDGDGDLDAFVANDGTPDRVWVNQGGAQNGAPGSFADSGQAFDSSYSMDVDLGDLDGDGDLDAFVTDPSEQGSRVLINQGGAQEGTLGQFVDSGQALGSAQSDDVALGDVDGDGDLDAFVANFNEEPNQVWVNQGGMQAGTPAQFLDSGQELGSYQSDGVALGDVDGDGDLDAFVANWGAFFDPSLAANRVYVNQTDPLGTIVVEKQTDPNGSPDLFTFSGDAAGSLADGEQIVVTSLAPGAYSAQEAVPEGWELTDITCDDANSSGDLDTATATFALEAGETVRCTFYNTQLGTIVVEKQTDPDGSPERFTFSGDAAGSIADGEQIVVPGLLPGAYNVQEVVPEGWELTDITCDDGNSSGDLETETATFVLEAGERVQCTFYNTQPGTIVPGTIVVEKQTDPDGSLESFDFYLDGDVAGSLADGEQIVVEGLAPGTYSAQEAVPEGWELTDITCDDENSSGDLDTAIATFALEAGETVRCTFTNQAQSNILAVPLFLFNDENGNGQIDEGETLEGETYALQLERVGTLHTGDYIPAWALPGRGRLKTGGIAGPKIDVDPAHDDGPNYRMLELEYATIQVLLYAGDAEDEDDWLTEERYKLRIQKLGEVYTLDRIHLPPDATIRWRAYTDRIKGPKESGEWESGEGELAVEYAAVTFVFDGDTDCETYTRINRYGDVPDGGTAYLPAGVTIQARAWVCGRPVDKERLTLEAGERTVTWSLD